MEGQEGAPQPAPQQEISAAATSPVEQPQPQKGPGPFRRLWMTVRGQNHQSPGEIHADLADKKLTESEPSVAEMANGSVEKTATTETAPQPPAPSAPEPVVKNDELRPIGVAATPTSNTGESTGDVDKMISELQENVKKDAAEDGAKAEEAPAPPTTVETPTEDTGEALDAVAASMVKMPETTQTATPNTQSLLIEEPASKPANVVDMTARTGVSSVAPNPVEPPTGQENISTLPTATPQTEQATEPMSAGSGSEFASNTPQPVKEAAIGMKSAVDASNASDKADADLAASAQKVIDIQEAKEQTEASMQPLTDTPTQTASSDQAAA